MPLLLIFLLLDLLRVRRLLAYALIWTAAGLVATDVDFRNVVKPVAATAAALMAGCVFWVLAGRSAGKWLGTSGQKRWYSGPRVFAGIDILDLAGYAVLAILAVPLLGYLHYAGRLFWVTYVSEPQLGSPPFRIPASPPGNRLTAFQKVALMDFPDAASCLRGGAGDLSPAVLMQMDWDKIDNDAEAEVCVFRLLASYDDLSHATAWFEGQGFRVGDKFSSANPYREPDGSLRLTGSWSIRENGPRYPTGGFVRRLFFSIPYGMGIDATWSEDGKTLQHVRIGYSTL